jgi:excisionase family DNA binding protein
MTINCYLTAATKNPVFPFVDCSERSTSMNDLPGNVLTIEELAIYLKISKSTLYKLVREGKIPSQKVGRHWRFLKKSIDRWLEETRPTTASG